MARVQLTSLLYDIRGKFGGGIFSNWKGVHVLRVPASSISNPATHKQAKAREVFSVLAKAWGGLSLANRDGWKTVAQYLSSLEGGPNPSAREAGSGMPSGRQKGPYTPIGSMIACHGLLNSVGLWDTTDTIIDAPVGVTCPAPADVTSLSGVGNTLTVDFTDPVDWGTGGHAGGIQIWARSEDGVFFPQKVGYVADSVETFDFSQLVPSGGTAPINIHIGQVIEVVIRPVNGEGLPGPASQRTQYLVVAAP
jgi:hypothetical protein